MLHIPGGMGNSYLSNAQMLPSRQNVGKKGQSNLMGCIGFASRVSRSFSTTARGGFPFIFDPMAIFFWEPNSAMAEAGRASPNPGNEDVRRAQTFLSISLIQIFNYDEVWP